MQNQQKYRQYNKTLTHNRPRFPNKWKVSYIDFHVTPQVLSTQCNHRNLLITVTVGLCL